MTQKPLFSCLIEEQTPDTAFIQMYWARAKHLGHAIQKMLSAARQNEFTNPRPREADPCEVEDINVDVYPSTEAEVFSSVTRFSFPPEPSFSFPEGIIPSGIQHEGDGSLDPDDIKPGYTRSKDENGLIEIGVNVESSDLSGLYDKMLRCRDRYDTFWYQLHDYWEDEETEFFENASHNQPATIMEHLLAYSHDSILNGFVTLTAYFEEGATNVNISDHKRIVILTYSDDMAAVFESRLEAGGYRHYDSLVSIDCRIHHRHYRTATSHDRKGLVAHLQKLGFTPWFPTRP